MPIINNNMGTKVGIMIDMEVVKANGVKTGEIIRWKKTDMCLLMIVHF